MPPKGDPYANKVHRRIDIILVLLTLIILFFAFRYSAHSRTSENANARPAQRAINH